MLHMTSFFVGTIIRGIDVMAGDERREKVLSEVGLRVVRSGNDKVVKNLFAVVGKIRGNIPSS